MVDAREGARLGAQAGAAAREAFRGALEEGAEDVFEPLRAEGLRLGDLFSDLGDGLASELERAARSGELSFKRLGASLAADLAGALGRRAGEGLGALVSGAISGARADGGAVFPGASFLVGGRGPEVFTPAAAGSIAPPSVAARSVQVTLNVTGVRDAADFRAAEPRLAAALGRAVARADRHL